MEDDRPTTIHLEGARSIEAALVAGRRRIEVVLVAEGADEAKLAELLATARRRKVAVKRVSYAELDATAHGRTHGGVVARCEPLATTSEAELLASVDATIDASKATSSATSPPTAAPLLLLLDGIDDARNLGFTLRSAEALGASAVVLKRHEFDFDETEVARASSGALDRLPLARIDRESTLLRELARRGVQLVACVASAKQTLFELDLVRPTLLAIGGEKRGLSGAVRGECTLFARIPTSAASIAGAPPPSLSSSHAAAVALAEAMRQRLTTTKR